MVVQQADDRLRHRRERTKQAITFAMEGKWEEEAEVNRLLVADFPNDVEAQNRLGKATSELGLYSEARAAFSRTLELDPGNLIAKKNLARLSVLSDDAPKALGGTRVPPHFFIEQMGKTGLVTLSDLPQRDVLAKSSAGEKVSLREAGARLEATTESVVLGKLDPRLSARLIGLMNGGNRYEGAISSVGEDRLVLFVKETYQHPSQKGRLSFPTRTDDSFKPYVWQGLRYKTGDDSDDDDGGGALGADDRAVVARRTRRGSSGFAAQANGEADEDE